MHGFSMTFILRQTVVHAITTETMHYRVHRGALVMQMSDLHGNLKSRMPRRGNRATRQRSGQKLANEHTEAFDLKMLLVVSF